eukprot:gene26696-29309_t
MPPDAAQHGAGLFRASRRRFEDRRLVARDRWGLVHVRSSVRAGGPKFPLPSRRIGGDIRLAFRRLHGLYSPGHPFALLPAACNTEIDHSNRTRHQIVAAPIYKITPFDLWAEAEASGRFIGAPVDLADGFIHFSTSEQVRETARRHFAGQSDLLLVSVDPAALGEALKWEPSRGGALFPHLYAPLLMMQVVQVGPLPLGEDGVHVFPEGIAE